ncbi:MAG: heme ABC exporter ATP-binding protein CcmA [Polyangiales bacterium]
MAERAFFDVVRVEKLTRVYGATRALAGVTLEFRAGDVCSVEGGNGAGKSTLLLVLATLVRPTAGRVIYGEYELPEDRAEVRAAIGLVGHEAMVYPDLTARESLKLMATLHDLPSAESRIEESLRAVGLTEFADRPARTYSRGQLQRLALARAELHDPSLLLFDEPTTGLDANATERLIKAVKGARERKRVVVVVTHDRPFAERVADVRITLERGKVKSSVRTGA